MHPMQLQEEMLVLQYGCIRSKTLVSGPCYCPQPHPPSWDSPTQPKFKACKLVIQRPLAGSEGIFMMSWGSFDKTFKAQDLCMREIEKKGMHTCIQVYVCKRTSVCVPVRMYTCVYDFKTLRDCSTVCICIPFNEVLYFLPVVQVTTSE